MSSKRPYQADCTKSIVDHFWGGITCQGVSLPCSSGKTVVVGTLPSDLGMLPGESLLFIAHRSELIDQAAEKFSYYNDELTVAIERATERAAPDADVVVASLQSMTPTRIKKFDPERFRIVVVDETHHAATSEQYQRLMEYFGVHRSRATLSRQKLLVGLSATWRRGDGKGYEHLYDKIVFHRSILDIMRQGITVGGQFCPYLAPIKSNRELTNMSLDKVRIKGGELDQSDLAKAVDTPERNNFIVDTWLEHGEGMPLLGFTVNVEHSHKLAKAFCDRGIPVEAIHGGMNKSDRRSYFEDFKNGTLKGLTSCDAITEGTDLPWACVGLNGKPMLSVQQYTQTFGRISRPWPSPEDRMKDFNRGVKPEWVKPYGLWFDFTDSSSKHNLCQAPTLFGLRPTFDFKGKDVEETMAAIEAAKAANPSLDIESLKSLDDLTHSSVAFTATSAPREDSDLRKWSSYPWQKECSGQWALPIRSTHGVLRVIQDGDKFGVWRYMKGAGAKVKYETTLRKAIQAADRLMSTKERKILQRDAPWRRDPPSTAQCIDIWIKDADLRRKYPDKQKWFNHCLAEYESGDMSYSKGAFSDMMAVSFVANRFRGPRGAGSPGWAAKAHARVKQKLQSKTA